MGDVYSYHTFLLPFIWAPRGDIRVSLNDFAKIFKDSDNWEDESIEKKFDKKWSTERKRQEFATYQYFHPQARATIYGQKRGIAKTYRWKKQGIAKTYRWKKQNGQYVIRKGEIEYRLSINDIYIRIFNTGVAVLVFELENTDENAKSIDHVKRINEWGRHISIPFIPAVDGGYKLHADEIIILFDKEEGCKLPFLEKEKKFLNDNDLSLFYIVEHLFDMLTCGTGYEIRLQKGEEKKRKKNFFVQLMSDDRMFTCCLVRDNTFMGTVRGALGDPAEHERYYNFQRNFDAAKALYAYLYVDEGEPSCCDPEMLNDLLEKSIYPRWLAEGTVHAVTHHSFMCLLTEDAPPHVIAPFLTQYINMMITVLAQRLSIISLAEQASKLAERACTKHNAINFAWKRSGRIIALHEKYVKFQNQILMLEMTAQEQGIELYQMMQRALYINEQKSLLDSQMHNLYEITTMSGARRLNKCVGILTCFAVVIGAIQVYLLC